MATTFEQLYGTNGQTFTITVASLTDGSARQSTEIDNTSNLFCDVLVFLKVKTGASGAATTGVVSLWLYSTVDNGTTRTDNAGASDAAITITNAIPLGSLIANVNATTYYGGPFSVASAFNGRMPAKWGLIVKNSVGGTLDATGGSHAALYQGINYQNV